MKYYKITCPKCGNQWIHNHRKGTCPKCRTRSYTSEPVYIKGYRLICKKCNLTWDAPPARRRDRCPNCSTFSSRSIPIYSSYGKAPMSTVKSMHVPSTTGSVDHSSTFISTHSPQVPCVNCGAEIPLNEQYCSVCGALQPSIESSSASDESPRETSTMAQDVETLGEQMEVICGNCGAKVDIHDDWCHNCGAKLI
ncbi:MAG: zinc-ribbon domain-containing protein [Candidatus Hermodarchaeota archaeon]